MKSSLRSVGRDSGRPHRSRHEVDAILRRQRLSGLSLLAFAREQGLCYATLLRWRRRGADPGNDQTAAPVPRPGFVPVELDLAAAGAEYVLNWAPKRSLRIPRGFDSAELRCLLEVLGVQP